MEERREFKRFHTTINAKYLVKDDSGRWNECSITNVSGGGVGVEMYESEKISLGSILQFEAAVRAKGEPIDIVGTLMWIEELDGNPRFSLKGGIKFLSIEAEDKVTLLRYASEGLR